MWGAGAHATHARGGRVGVCKEGAWAQGRALLGWGLGGGGQSGRSARRAQALLGCWEQRSEWQRSPCGAAPGQTKRPCLPRVHLQAPPSSLPCRLASSSQPPSWYCSSAMPGRCAAAAQDTRLFLRGVGLRPPVAAALAAAVAPADRAISWLPTLSAQPQLTPPHPTPPHANSPCLTPTRLPPWWQHVCASLPDWSASLTSVRVRLQAGGSIVAGPGGTGWVGGLLAAGGLVTWPLGRLSNRLPEPPASASRRHAAQAAPPRPRVPHRLLVVPKGYPLRRHPRHHLHRARQHPARNKVSGMAWHGMACALGGRRRTPLRAWWGGQPIGGRRRASAAGDPCTWWRRERVAVATCISCALNPSSSDNT